MWKKIQDRIFPFIIALSALSVSASAAFYSVSGLSKLFAGASLQVIIMAGSLEVAKLVIASLLYQYWDKLNKILRVYLSIATVVLILITSMGIYGFLSAAYQETANKAGNVDAQVTLVETKRDNIKEQLAVYTAEKESVNKSVTDLRAGLAGNVQTYKDKDGNILSTSSSANRKAFEKQLDQAIIRQTEINSKVDELNTKLFDYETEIVEIKTGNDVAGELGPLKYLSGLTGMPMDKIINILLLVIIFVFDPLAISLVVAANFAFAQLRPKKNDILYPEPQSKPENSDIEDNEGSDIYTEDELSDWDSTLMDGLEDEELESVYRQWEEGKDWDEIDELQEAWVYLSPDEKKIFGEKYQEYKNYQIKHLQDKYQEVQRSNKDSRWKSRNLQEINEKLNSLKSKNDDLTITY
jgi:hypothetical protein